MAGDTVLVRGGNYDERVTFSKSGTAGSKIIFKPYQVENVIIAKGFIIHSNYIRLEHFEVTPGETGLSSDQCQVTIEGDYNEIDTLNIHNTELDLRSALRINSGHNNTISNISLTYTGGFSSDEYSSNNTIKGGTIAYSGGKSIVLYGMGQIIDGLTIHDPGQAASPFDDADCMNIHGSGHIIRNNHIYNIFSTAASQHTDIIQWWDGVSDLTFENNTIGSFAVGGPFNEHDGGNFIMIEGNCPRITWKNNVFMGDNYFLFNIHPANLPDGSDWVFVNNTVYHKGGIRDNPNLRNWKIENNIFLFPIYFANASTFSIKNNLYIEGATKSTFDVNSIESASANFINPDISAATGYGRNADWRLQPSSPAINAGVLDSNTPPNDKDENLRNVGVPDIGAYEYGATEGTDDLPPSVSILSPSNNATVSNNVDISSSASDNINIMKVEFLIDDSLVSTQTVRGQDSNYGFSWDSRTVSNANHTLKAKAYDTSNNTNEASITINVNNLSCNGLSSVSQIANKLNPKTNTNSADNWNWWNNIIPKDQSCTTMFFQEVAPTDNTIYSMLWDRVVPEFWANQFYYKYLFDHAIPEKLSNSYYYTRFWNKAVSEYWTNGFYYKRLWDKAVPENWVSSSPDSYRTTFYTKAVPLNWSSSYYSSRLWNKAVPELWSNQHYYTYLFNTAIPSNLASDYYYNYFWNTAVPTLQANSFYYTRLWNKAIPENWVPESGPPGTYSYKWTFWIKAVPNSWSSSFYSNRFWNKAIPENWVNSYYKNTLNNEAKVGNWASGYYVGH